MDSRPAQVTLGIIGWAISHCLRIPTKEGVMLGREGDWIIRGVAGELYPCKPDIFAQTYERIE